MGIGYPRHITLEQRALWIQALALAFEKIAVVLSFWPIVYFGSR